MLGRFLPALLSAVAVVLGAGAAAAAPAPVPLTVREPDGIERRAWPLTVGVPFAAGTLRDGEALVVRDEQGAALPTQTRMLARWPDGSVRWLLVDTQLNLRPGQERRLRVEPGSPPPAAAALQVTESTAGIAIDTGVLRFTVPRARFAILDGLQTTGADATPLGPLTALLVAGERRGNAQPPTSLRVLERGPLRTRIELRGTYGNGFDYVVRLDAYAGQPFVRILHTFINTGSRAFVSVPQISLELPLGGFRPGRYRFGLEKAKPRHGPLPDEGLSLVQRDNESARIEGANEDVRLAGWLELGATRAALGFAARAFWQEYPQGFAVTRTTARYDLWSPAAGPAQAGIGAAKTHEVALWLAAPERLPPGVGAALRRPLVAVVDPNALAATGALPLAVGGSEAATRFARKAADAARRYLKRNTQERWNDCGKVHCNELGLDVERVGAYGMWNWGDWNFRGYEDRVKGTDSWGNLEYDTTEVLALSFTASGDAELHEAVVAAARHYMDVDTIHAYPARPEWVGMNHPKNPLHFSFELGGPDLGHTWTQGLVDYYYLTGDERGLAVARGIADYLATRVQGVVRGNPRQWGWPQIALLAVYEATGETRYRDAALRYATRGMEAHPPGKSEHWKLGILADALAHTHAATGDAAVRAWLEEYATTLMAQPVRSDARVYPALAYVGRLTDNAAMCDAALQRAQRLDLGSWGKPFSINGRIGFRIYSLLGG